MSTARYGEDSWAVVTGSSDGIGFECAKHLAEKGFNIVLMARNLEKLNDCALKIQRVNTESGKTPKTRVVQIDFSKQYTAETFNRIYTERLSDIDISILINNVGVANCGNYIDLTD